MIEKYFSPFILRPPASQQNKRKNEHNEEDQSTMDRYDDQP